MQIELDSSAHTGIKMHQTSFSDPSLGSGLVSMGTAQRFLERQALNAESSFKLVFKSWHIFVLCM